MVHFLTYLCMYLSQAVSLPPQLGIDWDFFQRIHLAEEGKLEPAVVGYSVAAPLSPVVPLQPRQAHRGKTGLFRSRNACNRLHLRSEMGLRGRNPATQAVRPSPS